MRRVELGAAVDTMPGAHHPPSQITRCIMADESGSLHSAAKPFILPASLCDLHGPEKLQEMLGHPRGRPLPFISALYSAAVNKIHADTHTPTDSRATPLEVRDQLSSRFTPIKAHYTCHLGCGDKNAPGSVRVVRICARIFKRVRSIIYVRAVIPGMVSPGPIPYAP